MGIVSLKKPSKSPKDLKKRLKEFEGYWQIKLQTLEPYGMNLFDEFYNAEYRDRAGRSYLSSYAPSGVPTIDSPSLLVSIEVEGKTVDPNPAPHLTYSSIYLGFKPPTLFPNTTFSHPSSPSPSPSPFPFPSLAAPSSPIPPFCPPPVSYLPPFFQALQLPTTP